MGKEELSLGLEITELRLGLPGADHEPTYISDKINEKKRVYSEINMGCHMGAERKVEIANNDQGALVGWPPVCSYRRKNSFSESTANTVNYNCKMYVKVSMDGAPFLRKIDLVMYKGYSDLAMALEMLFGCSGICKACKDTDSSENVPIYEDKEGDWMLVGDVPWEMFVESCKRLRIMKRSEAKGFGLKPKGSLEIFKEAAK